MIVKYQLEEQAERAIELAKFRSKKARNEYGIALAYILALRGLSYAEAGRRIGLTGKTVEHMVQNGKSKAFDPVRIDKMCDAYNVDRGYFRDLVAEIGKRIQGGKS